MNSDRLQAALEDAVRETGITLQQTTAAVAAYAAQRAAHLATIAGQPGFDEAVRAERDSVVLFAGIGAVRAADAGDQRLIGLIHGALAVAAGA